MWPPQKPGKITFFNEDYEVLGKLEQTGTSYDTCVFMTWDTAQQIMNSDQWQLIFRGARTTTRPAWSPR